MKRSVCSLSFALLAITILLANSGVHGGNDVPKFIISDTALTLCPGQDAEVTITLLFIPTKPVIVPFSADAGLIVTGDLVETKNSRIVFDEAHAIAELNIAVAANTPAGILKVRFDPATSQDELYDKLQLPPITVSVTTLPVSKVDEGFDSVDVVHTQPKVTVSSVGHRKLNFTVDVPVNTGRLFVIDFQPFDPYRNFTTLATPCEVQVFVDSNSPKGKDKFKRVEFYASVDEIQQKCVAESDDKKSYPNSAPPLTISEQTHYNSQGQPIQVVKTCGNLYVSAVSSLKDWNIDDRFSVVTHQFGFCIIINRSLNVVGKFATLPTVDAIFVSAIVLRTPSQKYQYLSFQFATKLAVKPFTDPKSNFLADPEHVDFQSQKLGQLKLVGFRKASDVVGNTSPIADECELVTEGGSSSSQWYCLQYWTWESKEKTLAGPQSFTGKYVFEFKKLFEDGKPLHQESNVKVLFDLTLDVAAEVTVPLTQFGLNVGFFNDPEWKSFTPYFRKGERIFVGLFLADAGVKSSSPSPVDDFKIQITNAWICTPSQDHKDYKPVWDPDQGLFGCKQSSVYIPTKNIEQLIAGDPKFNDGVGVPTQSDVKIDGPCKNPKAGFSCAVNGFSFLAKPLTSLKQNFYFLHVEVTVTNKHTGRRLATAHFMDMSARLLAGEGDVDIFQGQATVGSPGIASLMIEGDGTEEDTESTGDSDGDAQTSTATASGPPVMVIAVVAVAAFCSAVIVASMVAIRRIRANAAGQPQQSTLPTSNRM